MPGSGDVSNDAQVGMESGIGLLARRLRAGALIVALGMVAFVVSDLAVQGDGVVELLAIKLVQVSLLVFLLRATSRESDVARLRWLAAAVLGAVYLTTILSAVVRGEILAAVLLLLAMSMATATFVPWGGAPQLLSVACAGGSIAAASHALPENVPVDPLYLWISSAIVLLGSVWIAREHEQHWAERWRTEERLAVESRVSAALARVGEEMIRSEATSGVLGGLCGLVAELLSCDQTALVLYDAGDDTFAVSSSFGHRPADLPFVESLRVSASAMRPLLGRLAHESVVEVDGTVARPAELGPPRERRGYPRTLLAPLRHGDEVIGVITAHYRDGSRPFSDPQKRILLGTAYLASLALQNVRLLDELREASRLKSDFVSTMSHELRTPVSVILGYAEMLSDSSVPADWAEILARVRRSGLELLELVEDTLSLGRLEAGGDPPVPERVDVPAVFAELANEFAAAMRLDDVALRWEGPASLVVTTDRRKLRTILKNLVGNALKFTLRGEVVLSCTREGRSARFVVRDTGIGIASHHLPIIFDMFRQIDSSDARSYRGAGLGLHIVQRLVHQLGGEITVASELGRGSAFTFAIPVPADDRHGVAGASSAA